MSFNTPNHLLESPLYKKAMEIGLLSRNISSYLNEDLCLIQSDGTEDNNIYISGDIVQQSNALAPEILHAEINKFHNRKKYKHLSALRKLTRRLYKNCNRLENCKSNGKDYVPVLKRELKIFNRLQKQWMLTL